MSKATRETRSHEMPDDSYSVIQYEDETQSFKCSVCLTAHPIAYRALNHPERFMLAREEAEQIHIDCRCYLYREKASIERLRLHWSRGAHGQIVGRN